MTTEPCIDCGKESVHEEIAAFEVLHSGTSRQIQDRRMVCGECCLTSYVGSQISEHELAVAAAVRDIDGLLSAEDLRRIRAKYRFKQTDMEKMLSTGEKTWTRWERGKVPHSKAADKLLRIMSKDPKVARHLMEEAGIVNLDSMEIFNSIDQRIQSVSHALFRAEFRRLEMNVQDKDADRVADEAFAMARDVLRRAEDACEEAA